MKPYEPTTRPCARGVDELERALAEREVLDDTVTEHERRVPYRKIF